MEDRLVGVDVTSTYPEAAQALPKVGHNRNISAEGILALSPDLVIGKAGELRTNVLTQLQQAGLDVKLIEPDYSVEGAVSMVKQVCVLLGKPDAASPLVQKIQSEMEAVEPLEKPCRALFIYARGAGTLMVAGTGTQLQDMITLAGGTNAVKEFEGFKPLTAESLVVANPDVIILFESGMESLDGMNGLMEVPGIGQTNAGKNMAFVSMDGQLLSGFGPRVGQAATELNAAFRQLGK